MEATKGRLRRWEDRPAVAAVFREDADGFVEAGRHKLPAGGGVVDVQHGRDVVHVDRERPLQVPHVVRVQTGGRNRILSQTLKWRFTSLERSSHYYISTHL